MTATNPPVSPIPSPVALIAWEAAHRGHTSKKEAAIPAELGLTPARYYQLLTRAARDLTAIAADPFTCRAVREQDTTHPRGA